MINKDSIVQGDCLEVMRQMPDKWVNCIITSPPYWGLRDYGIEPLIWDGDPECEHSFDSKRTPRPNGSGGKTDFIKNTHARKDKDNISEYVDYNDSATYSQVCLKCNAWRGSLGLEPTMDMYINHLCSIFDEAKRVLRDDGTLWVNLGDTYASDGSQETRFWHGSNQGKHQLGNGDGLLSKEYSGRCRTNEVPSKSLCMIPFRYAIEMVNRGWILRNDIIWHKPNCMPSSAKDRFTVDFEHVFFFSKSKRYYFEQQFEPLAEGTIPRLARGVSESNKWVNGADGQTKHTMSQPRENKGKQYGTNYGGDWKCNRGHSGYFRLDGKPLFDIEKGRNKRSVWNISTKGFPEAHFATFPETLVEPMIKAGCPEGGIVYDPFMGAGTVAVVAKRLNRHYVGVELKADYIEMANRRIAKEIPQMEFRLAGG
jgi:site-specific DNA-methyltransferase (adenine-specific)